MFDIGFWELTIIGVVALIVIGPEKLPAVARTVGYWFGKTQRFVATVKEDINREVSKTEELKRLVEEQSKIKDMHEIIEHTIDDAKKSVSIAAPLHQPKPMEDSKPGEQSPQSSSSTTVEPSQSRTADQINEQAK